MKVKITHYTEYGFLLEVYHYTYSISQLYWDSGVKVGGGGRTLV